MLILLVMMSGAPVFGQITEGFEGATPPPAGWSYVSVAHGTNNPRNGSKCATFDAANDAIITPIVASPDVLTFYWRRSGTAPTSPKFTVQTSTSQAGPWTNLPSANVTTGANPITSFTTSYQTFTADLSSFSNICVRVIDGRSGGSNQLYLDDFSITVAASDVTPPTASTFSPLDNATNVAISTNLGVTFSENIAKGTGNILIKKVSDNSVVQTIDVTSAAVTISSATLTINPPSDLTAGTAYYVEIPATAVQDLAGNFYAGISGATAWNFTTAAADATAPTASSFSPTNGATSVAVNSDLAVTFSESIAKGTGNILIKKVSDNSVVQTIDVTSAAVTVSSATLTINPASDLAASTAYYVEIPATAVQDLSGNFFAGFSGSTTWSFTTVSASSNCDTESFTNIPTASSSYNPYTWVGDDGASWSVTNSRTDQTITGKAITVRGILTTPTVTGGCGVITVSHKIPFSESSPSFTVWVNGTQYGSAIVPTSGVQVSNITVNVGGSVSIELRSDGSRITFDDMSWTCYVPCVSPTTQASALTFGSITANSVTANYTRGNGDKILGVVGAGSSPANPVSGNVYAANTAFGSGGAVGSGFAVYDGTAATFGVTSLSPETHYYVNLYEYLTATSCYSPTALAGNFWTLSTEPTAHSTLSASAVSGSQIDLTFQTATTFGADGYIILQKVGSAPTGTPTDATAYTVGGTIGDGTIAAIVTSSSATTQAITGLTAGTTYYYSLIPFNWNLSNIGTYNYRTAATIPTAFATPTVASKLAITGTSFVAPVSAYTAGQNFSVTVQAQDASNNVRSVSTATTVTLSVANGSGSLTTITGIIAAGASSVTITTTYDGIESGVQFMAAATSGMSLTTSAASSAIQFYGIDETLFPQYVAYPTASGNNRVPVAYRLTLSGLLANTTYRAVNGCVVATDDYNNAGAGNAYFVPTSGNFVYTNATSISTNYINITTDSRGNYTGWFITEPTQNATFTAGNNVYVRIALNDGAGGSTPALYLTTKLTMTAVAFGSAASNVTGIRSTSLGTAQDFVLLSSNMAGTGRPLYCTFIESDGNTVTAADYVDYYDTNVDGVAGAWGAIIPNTNTNGVRYIAALSRTTGNVVGCAATDADGNWNGVSTVNPNTGVTAKVIATGDAPLTCQPEIQVKQLGTNYNTANTYNFGFAQQSANTDVVFTIKNTGVAALTISTTTVTGTGYSLVSSPAASVNAGDSTTFTVRFNSGVTGTFTGNVSIAHSDNSGSENPYVVNFTAKVLPEIVVEQNGTNIPDGSGSVAFGTASIGGQQEKIFVISNTGSGDLIISSPVFGGANASEFSIVGGVGIFPITVAAGENTNIIIRFSPAGVDGAHSATFSFTTNDTDENPYNFTLTGTQATPPSVSVNAKDPSPSSQPTLGSQNNVLYRVALKANGSTATLQSIRLTTQGTYAELDVTSFRLWVSANNSFSTTTDTEIGTPLTAASGGSLLFDGLSQTISASDSVYFFITANIRIDNAASNKTVGVSMTSFSDLTFSGSPTSGTISVAAGASHTIVSPSVKFSLADASLAEGTGAGTSTYNIALRFFGNVPANENIVINLSGAATGNGTDYDFGTPGSGLTKVSYVGNVLTLRTGTITTPATINLPINITRDAVDEPNEDVVLTIANAGAIYIDNNAKVFTFTITDDDAASVVSFASTEEYKGEAVGSSYTVTLDIVPAAAVSGNIVLNVSETDLTYGGTSPDDYTTSPAKAGSTVTIPITVGQSSATFNININDDETNTNPKTTNSKVVFSIASVPSNAIISSTDHTHTLHIVEGTFLEQGDLAILGFNTSNIGSDDEISFVCFKDLIPGTVIDITDNSYNKCTPGIASPSSTNYILNAFGESEGWARMTFTSGSTIAAGTVITMVISGGGPTSYTGSSCISPAGSTWTFTGMSSNTGNFNLNSNGEQIFFLQGGTLDDNGTGPTNVNYGDDLYVGGRILYVFNTKGDIWTPTCTNSAGGGTQNSGKPSDMDCFISYNPNSGTVNNYYKYTGPVTETSKRGWIQRIQGSGNWTPYTSASNYNSGGPNYRGGYSISIGAGAFEAGVWEGTTNSNWFECRNWQSLTIPEEATDVTMVSTAPNNIVIDTATAKCHNITIASTKSLTIANTGGSGGNLNVYGDFNNQGTFTHTAGVVTMKGSSLAQLTQASGTLAFRSLDVANSGGVILNNDISANTALTLTSGTLNMNGKKITLNNGSLDVVAGILDGTANGSTLEYTGTGGTNVPTGSYDKLIVNRTGNTLVMLGDVTLRGALGTALDYPAGTLNINSYTLTLESGVMTGASGVIQAKGSNSDLVINGSGAVGTLRSTGGFDDFTLNRTSSGGVTLGSNLTINDECNLPEGTLNIGNGNTLALKGAINWTNGGLTGGTTSHLSVEQIDGTTARLILPTPTGGLGNVSIKRLNGMSLFGSLAVAGTVSFSSSPASGGIYTTNDTLDLGTTGTITGETANVNTRYVQGIVKATRTVGNGGSSNFGNIGVNVSSSPSDLGTVRAYRFAGSSHAVTFGANAGIARLWRIKPTAQPSGALGLSLAWPADDDNGTNASTSSQVYRLPEGATDWEQVGTVQSPSVVNGMRTVSVSTSGFSDWTVSDDINTLPVTLVSFTGYLQGNVAQLQWITAFEYQNKGFRVERSADGKHYESIGFVSGVGTSSASQRYGFADQYFTGKAYYRLAQVDIDGEVTYSHAVYLEQKGKLTANFALSPNPATSYVNLQMLGTASESPIMMQVISAEGRQLSVAQGDIMHLNRSLNQTISSLASGVYIIQLQLNDQVEHLRLVKE
ncbi:Ig-like domain-containing protein [Flexibacter flexilis]|nr:Ig-like domain-containing protein [Flexibacter flexilis]